MRPAKIVALAAGSILVVVSVAMFIGGGAAVWAHTTQRDADGYYTSSTEDLDTSTYAITSERIDLGTDQGAGEWNPIDDVGTLRLRVERTDGGEVFVGLARADDVERYLADVTHAEIDEIFHDPFGVRYDVAPGERVPADPVSQGFWIASAVGEGRQALTWELDEGEWMAVVMNADAARGIAVRADAGLNSGWLLPIGVGLLAAGLLVAALGLALVLIGARRGTPRSPAAAPAAGVVPLTVGPRTYPLRLDGHLDAGLRRWLWLVKWFLAIPHLVVLAVLWVVAGVLTVVAGFAILFTGRYPRTIFDFNTGVLRWTWRVTFYAFTFGTDRYPPFTLAAADDEPAQLVVEYPAELSRPLVLVKWWLLALPHLLIVGVFGGGVTWWAWPWAAGRDGGAVLGGGLIGLLVVIAGFALLFRGRYPRSLFDFVMGMQRWSYRVVAYVALMTDEYPPFRLDLGGTDPGSVPAPAPPPPAPPPETEAARPEVGTPS